ncbi:glycosyltransferase family 4 protein [Maribacter forsetii]|uniref:glycosyltransferase family 4 protein n=1 Tax=Maribacter forsetii TaxID=444515 RepID=UPI000568D9D8|nr:glycosyltransferase family 4 protein [Maribacter forsetii]
MNILHICNDYFGSKVHRNLYKSLDELGVNQTIYCPVRQATLVKPNLVEYNYTKVIISESMNNFHRILFNKKIKFLYQDLTSKINLTNISLTHATNLFSDGAIAYRIFKEKNIPYIIAVRSTDIEVFLTYRPDLIQLAWNILKNARKIIFISEALKMNFLNHYLIAKKSSYFKNNCHVQFNGIDNFWLNNIQPQRKIEPTQILYVGRLLKRKNVIAVANTVIKLNISGVNCKFNIVGEGGGDEKKLIELTSKHPEYINYIGAIKDKEKLKSIYNENQIFTMPSKGETFGLVYIEALSQGLPVLFSKNDGIYGVFQENIGEYCNPDNHNDIYQALQSLIINYQTYEIDKIDFKQFQWKNIAFNYKNIYEALKA